MRGYRATLQKAIPGSIPRFQPVVQGCCIYSLTSRRRYQDKSSEEFISTKDLDSAARQCITSCYVIKISPLGLPAPVKQQGSLHRAFIALPLLPGMFSIRMASLLYCCHPRSLNNDMCPRDSYSESVKVRKPFGSRFIFVPRMWFKRY